MNRRNFLQAAIVAGVASQARLAWPQSGPDKLIFAEASKPGPRAMIEAADSLAGAPYAVEWSEFNATPLMLTALAGGAVDVCGGGSTALVFLAANTPTLGLKAIFAQQIGGPGAQNGRILVPKDSPLHHVRDLKGKRIAVTRGTQLHYQVVEWLRRAGVRYDQVTLASLQPSEALAVLQRSEVDAWAVYEPYASVAELENGARALEGTPMLGDYGLVFASEQALEDPAKVARIRDFLHRLAVSERWLQAHQERWIETAAKLTGLPEAVARRSAPRTLATPVAITDQVVASVQAQADVFREVGVINTPVNLADAFDRRFADALS
ncbi:PhnD/SsuA/transferrin family substrate-binding protein [Pseudomonas typographi]|uniref:PhnD/SsuA/transferrin family substrate-binding protein n=1 Tax=Pseudomonas typographi TaxID=2715964 RepID=UPI00168875CF|nr:transporter substrate-binding domain-containing protein [Pseudomonas typographi]MBD1550544.1 transporter substrate-binding domain-containing protein [Pseudomonas typographi]